jgi:hypothetical protein
MNAHDSSPPEGGALQLSAHLLPALREAALLAIESACEGDWEDDQLDRVRPAVHMLDALEAGNLTREQVAVLADRAAAMQGDAVQSDAEDAADSFPVSIGAAWPVTAHAVDVLEDRVCLTRDLIRLRDEARG